jgi:hypothetical protein
MPTKLTLTITVKAYRRTVYRKKQSYRLTTSAMIFSPCPRAEPEHVRIILGHASDDVLGYRQAGGAEAQVHAHARVLEVYESKA